MRNRKGFTLMELLLVVAVLAIVAAAAAPTFFGGASEAMNEAKKSSFLSAYQNTLSGANLYLSVEAAKGNAGTAVLDEGNLAKYAPLASRYYELSADVKGNLSAQLNSATKAVEVVVKGKDTPITLTPGMDYATLLATVANAD